MNKANSFDVFDTIIARRCIYPNYVFFLLEEACGVKGLCRSRIMASCLAAVKQEGSHSLEDIYDELACLIDLSKEKRSEIMAMELRIEFDNVIPINENINLLQKDDVLISDMYLSSEVIESYLRKSGIVHTHALLRTPSGKSTGKLWREIANNGFQFQHVGDCPRSDFHMARRAGMNASITNVAKPTFLERRLLVNDQRNIAFLIREARLKTSRACEDLSVVNQIDYRFNIAEYVSELQVNLNLPLLMRQAMFILNLLKDANKAGTLLFSSRGSSLLLRLCSRLIDELELDGVKCKYWLSSRDARLLSSQDYIEYCLSLVNGDRALFVDLTGSGLSFSRLREKLMEKVGAGHGLDFFLGLKLDSNSYKQAAIEKRTGIDISDLGMQLGSCYELSHAYWRYLAFYEYLNFSPEGKVLDVLKLNGGFLPIREPYEFDFRGRSIVSYSQNYCEALVDNLAPLVAKNLEAVGEEIGSDSFDYVVDCCFRNFHDEKYLTYFQDFFKDGHLRSEALHLKRNFNA